MIPLVKKYNLTVNIVANAGVWLSNSFRSKFCLQFENKIKTSWVPKIWDPQKPTTKYFGPRNTHEGTIAQYHQTPETHNAT